jgi:hypothetical protein
VITLAMLYIARSNSRGRPEFVTHTENGYTFAMTTVPKLIEFESGRVTLDVAGLTVGDEVVFRTSQPRELAAVEVDEFDPVPMQRSDSIGNFFVDVTAGKKPGRFHYYFEVLDSTGSLQATLMAEDGKPFFLRYIGVVPAFVLISHVVFIFATVFCVAMAAVHAGRLLIGGDGLVPMAKFLFWAMVFCFLGGYPFGWPMNYYAFDCLWEGVPFGTDATDNKTQLLFVYLLFASLASWGSFRGKGRDLFAPKTLGVIGLGSFAVMLFIYLIPHSIQFEPGFTYAFCYTWIGIVAALYVFGLLKSRRAG